MPGTIASQPTIRGQVLDALRTNTNILSILRPSNPADAVGAILSAAGATERPAAPPFLLVRAEGVSSLGDDDLELGTWAIECHVAPNQRTFILDRLVEEIGWLFEHTRWERPSVQRTRPIISQRAGSTGELADEGFTTIKRIVRIHLYSA